MNCETSTSIQQPNIGSLRLIIITCNCCLNCNLNLELIAKNLKLDDHIIGKKLLGVCEDGIIKTKPKTSRKNYNNQKKTQRRDFSNQCTIVIKSPTGQNINLKIFGNSKIVITGGLSKEDGKHAVLIFKEKIKHLTDTYQIKPNTRIEQHFDSVINYIKYMNKNYLILLKLFSLYNLNIDLKLELILNKKVVDKYLFNQTINDLFTYPTYADLEGFLKIIQIFNICHLYLPNSVLLDHLEQPNNHIHGIISQLYNCEQVELPVTFDKENLDNDFEITIENYNTIFNSGFHNNREVFTQILNNKYKSTGLISSVKFEPSNYQGINVKYISRVLCHQNCQSTGKKNTPCKCKEISFLIFQEGNIMITGGRYWEQVTDGYQTIKTILLTEYHNIAVDNSKPQYNKDQPPHIIDIDKDNIKIIYLNKQKQIIENPRTVYILKQIGLLDKYL